MANDKRLSKNANRQTYLCSWVQLQGHTNIEGISVMLYNGVFSSLFEWYKTAKLEETAINLN